jgi:hypothetical protein
MAAMLLVLRACRALHNKGNDWYSFPLKDEETPKL